MPQFSNEQIDVITVKYLSTWSQLSVTYVSIDKATFELVFPYLQAEAIGRNDKNQARTFVVDRVKAIEAIKNKRKMQYGTSSLHRDSVRKSKNRARNEIIPAKVGSEYLLRP